LILIQRNQFQSSNNNFLFFHLQAKASTPKQKPSKAATKAKKSSPDAAAVQISAPVFISGDFHLPDFPAEWNISGPSSKPVQSASGNYCPGSFVLRSGQVKK
jgi:hypothetical protein